METRGSLGLQGGAFFGVGFAACAGQPQYCAAVKTPRSNYVHLTSDGLRQLLTDQKATRPFPLSFPYS